MPGLELLGAEGVCDILDRITQTVGVVIGGVDAPARHERKANDTLKNKTTHEVKQNTAEVAVPFISRPMVGCVFDSICYRVELPVLHDHLHPERRFSFSKQAVLHPLKQHERLLDGPLSPGRVGNVVALQFLSFLVTYVSMTPAGRSRRKSQ